MKYPSPRTRSEIGYGIQNTKIITDAFPRQIYTYAAGQILNSYPIGTFNDSLSQYGYQDVFLPSLEELKKFYLQKAKFDIIGYDESTGNSAWSSTQDDDWSSRQQTYYDNRFQSTNPVSYTHLTLPTKRIV